MHGPCDERCMMDGKCFKGFPMEFRDAMTVPNYSARGGYPIYWRPNNGKKVKKKTGKGRSVELDNRHVVPYNMNLLKRYNCHFNVMVCSGIESIKYVYKKASRANVSLSERKEELGVDTVDNFFDGLCIGSAEACWRLFGFELAACSSSIVEIHTPDNQGVVFEEEGQLADVIQETGSADTNLTAWFKFNMEEKRRYQAELAKVARGDTVEKPVACYADIGSIAVWDSNRKRWKRRKRRTACFCRLPFVHPQDKERWCLKQLVCALPGATSWDDLKTVPGVEGGEEPKVCGTFQSIGTGTRGRIEMKVVYMG